MNGEHDATVVRALHIGRRDHYRDAAALLDRQPRRVVLMQRSSTLILGAEAGWDAERQFLTAARRSIAAGADWFHIASSEGIAAHLSRPTSSFPDIARRPADPYLGGLDGAVTIGNSPATARVVADLSAAPCAADLKLDRQARLLAAHFGRTAEAIVVTDVGDHQCSLHACGPYADELFELCAEFWSTCPPLRWDVVTRLVGNIAGDIVNRIADSTAVGR